MRQRTRLALGSVFVVGATLAIACTGDDPEPIDPDEGTGATSSTSGGGGTSGSGTGGSSGTSGTGPDGGGCTPGCKNASTLTTCTGPDETCQFECSTTTTPHCTRLYPSGLVAPEMLSVAETKAVTLASTRANAVDGSMSKGVRGPNKDPSKLEVMNGIGFQRVEKDGQKLSVWMFASFVVPQGANIHFSNENPVAFVAATEATMMGVIDVRPYNASDVLCGTEVLSGKTIVVGGPGGSTGNFDGVTTAGPGAGSNAAPGVVLGAGGGGFGIAGGKGGGSIDMEGAPGGPMYGDPKLVPLVGGSGGGGNGSLSGGSGGGAFQLVAGTKIVIGDGTNAAGVNAGGCGGYGSASTSIVAGAGGSGGAILVETPTLEMKSKSGLAANGANAGGRGGKTGVPAELGDLPIDPATTYGTGSGGTRMGGGGQPVVGGNSAGGSVGRIRLNLRTSTYSLATGAILSPHFTAPIGAAATSGKADIH